MGARDVSCIAVALVLVAAPAAAAERPGHATRVHVSSPAQKTFEIADYSFDIEQVISIGDGNGDRAGRVSLGSIHIKRKSDGASHRLWQAATSGAAVPKLILDTMRHGKRVRIVLHDVSVIGYQQSGDTERFTLRPAWGELAD